MTREFEGINVVGSDDHDLIKRVIAGSDSKAKLELADNFYLTDDEVTALAAISSVQGKRVILARPFPDFSLPQELLTRLLSDKSLKVRVSALANSRIDLETFKEAVFGDEIPLAYKKWLYVSVNVTKDIDIFSYLWELADEELLYTLDDAMENIPNEIDPKVVAFVEDNLQDASDKARAVYASWSYFWTDVQVLESLKDDKSLEVIRSLAENHRVASIHAYLAGKYRQESVQRILVRNSQDIILLERVYKNAASAKVRNDIRNNTTYQKAQEDRVPKELKKEMSIVKSATLTDEEWVLLSDSASVETRKELARRKDIPESILSKLTEDTSPDVQVAALNNPLLTNFNVFKSALLDGRLLTKHKKALGINAKAVMELEVFEHLWSIKGGDHLLLDTIDRAFFVAKYKEENPLVDNRVFGFIEQRIHSASKPARQMYANRFTEWNSPVGLDSLKDDKALEVIENLARNTKAWGSTLEYLLDNRYSTGLALHIAWATSSNQLLNKIYHGATSQEVYEMVTSNPAFELQADVNAT